MRMAPQTRPYIGVNTDFLPTHKLSPAQIRLNLGYLDANLAAGGFPLVLPPIAKEVDLDGFLDRVDGFVLSGGLDMDPRRVGQSAHHALQPMPERRDASDRALVRKLLQRQMPVLGIGVGMQQVNAALGGSLYPHLPEDLPRALPHYDPSGGPHRHAVMLEPGTRMEEIYGAGEIRVNSAHHQAIRQPGTGLRIGARAPDGVIEAIESTDPNWFCIGVQWHPESETATALDLQLFECFLQACVRQAQTLQLAA
jgi:putative glutamine amidotransferase